MFLADGGTFWTGLRVIEAVFLAYFLLHNSLNLVFTVLSFFEVRRRIIGRGFDDLDMVNASPFTSPISVLVPAYNEEMTIVESLRSLVNLKFPRVEIIVINDGSTDTTLDVVAEAFNLRQTESHHPATIKSAKLRGFYESYAELPDHVTRMILIDKENGGRADALNAGINACQSPYFLSIDADSLLDDQALLQTCRTLLDDEEIVAIGGQIGIVNGCEVDRGQVVAVKMPTSRVARFQIVEYVRSFTTGRSAMARLDSLLIISGAFGIFRKDIVEKVGGYLTRFITSRIAREYTRPGADTVCEDMELIVRIHRYLREKGLAKRIAYVPHPLCWTEVPETLESLGKQRNRWQRGLIEIMVYYRKMIFNRRYGRIGLFSMPYYLLFEMLGAPIEILGYLSLPVLFILDDYNLTYVALFLCVSFLFGVLLSTTAVLISAWPEKTNESDASVKSLIYFNDFKSIITLIYYGIIENFGYRQLTVWWRVMGIIDFWRGKKGWDKFERKGFSAASTGEVGHASVAD